MLILADAAIIVIEKCKEPKPNSFYKLNLKIKLPGLLFAVVFCKVPLYVLVHVVNL